ncbi:MAG: DEAD/DEAH box helicase family protein [Chloroflexota bacterium]|nr:DEAD/DEAH box helicase family protein [Chloroflexota bacterium]
MKLKFNADQEYQLQAIEAVVNLLDGQARVATTPSFLPGASGVAVVSNRLTVSGDDILRNLRRVQKENGIGPDMRLHSITGAIETPAGRQQKVTFPNFSVEMETGTGKTYVYLRTAFELARS